MISVCKVADSIGKLLGSDLKLAKKVKTNRTKVLKVSSNNYTIPMLLPISGGNMMDGSLDLINAAYLENKFYSNRSIKRGQGQKILYKDVIIPFNLQDREWVKNNGSFVTPSGDLARFRSVEYQQAKDTAKVTFEVQKDYIASNTYEEKLITPT